MTNQKEKYCFLKKKSNKFFTFVVVFATWDIRTAGRTPAAMIPKNMRRKIKANFTQFAEFSDDGTLGNSLTLPLTDCEAKLFVGILFSIETVKKLFSNGYL